MNLIIEGDNLPILQNAPSESIELIYIDPPFNTGKQQQIHGNVYNDSFDDLIEFFHPRIVEAHRILKQTGSFFLHIDYREVHYVKVMLDKIFGRANFRNEIIWAYDYGGRPKTKWPCKHDNILWYTKSEQYTYNLEESDRIEYMAPKLVGAEKAERGKTPTDVWWHTIVHTTGSERVDYPTQKPLGILERIIKVHSNPNDRILDFFAGSGTTGEAAAKNNRQFICIDENHQAVEVMKKRLAAYVL